MLEDLSRCRCSECPFSNGEGGPIPEREVPAAPAKGKSKLTIIGEHPRSNDTGKEDAADGMQGVFIRDALRRSGSGLKPRDVTIVNAVRCWAMHPTKAEIKKAADCCAPRLNLPEGPKLALGQHALFAAEGHREWKKWAGARVQDTWVSNSVLEMFAQPHYRTALAIHINRALEPDVPAPRVVIDDGPEMQKALRELIGKEISVDIETAGTNPFYSPILCIGVGTPELVVSVPWAIGPQNTVVARPRTRALLLEVLRSATCLIAHNGAHDFSALTNLGWELAEKRFDTFLAHGVAIAELPHRLQYVAGLEFPVHAWKGAFVTSAHPDAKGLEAFTDRPIEELQKYNCLWRNTGVITEDGVRPIHELVREKYRGRVLSYDYRTAQRVWKPVVGWIHQAEDAQDWIEIQLGTSAARRYLKCTPDHKIGTTQGLIDAERLTKAHRVYVAQPRLTKEGFRAALGTLLGDTSLTCSPAFRKNSAGCTGVQLTGGHSDGLASYKAKKFAEISNSKWGTTNGGYKPDAKFEAWQTRTSWDLLSRLQKLEGFQGPNDRLRITPQLLKMLGPVGWAWWFMDDGCKASTSVRLALCRYTEKERQVVKKFVERRWGSCAFYNNGVLGMHRETSRKFCTFIAPFVPQNWRYKLIAGQEQPEKEWDALSNHPTSAPVRSIKRIPWATHKTRTKKSQHRQRYCLTVADTHNFFTTNGLVRNCEDVAYTARLKAPLERRLYEAPHDGWKHYALRSDLNDVLCKMTEAGMPFDEGARAQLDTWVNLDAQRYKALFEEFAGGIDAGKDGGTQAVKNYFFKTLKAPVIARTDTEAASLSKDVLKRYTQELKGTKAAQAAKLLLKFKLYGKLHGTFTREGAMDVYEGRVMPSWNAVGTVGGRLSCSNPNLQQMPLHGRKMFVAPPGWVFVEADLSQLEPRIMAELSEDPGFVEVYEKGLDLYLRVAEALFSVPYDKVSPEQRQIAKMALLASNYGVGAESFREQLAARGVYVSLPQADAFLKNLKRGFPVMNKWKQGLVAKAEELGYVEEPFSGWRRYFYNKKAEAPKCYNFPLQAGGAALVNEMVLEIDSELDWKHEKLVTQIHDAIGLLVKENRAEKWRKRLPEIMYRKLKHVELISGAKVGKCWYDVK